MNFKDKNSLNWFLLIFWMGIIYFLSSRPDLKSGFESRIDFILRKIAHIAEYGILTFLAWRALVGGKETEFPKGNSVSKMPQFLIFAIIFSIFYAISDEYHQSFIYGRFGGYLDVLIDSAGIMIAGMAIWRRKIIKL